MTVNIFSSSINLKRYNLNPEEIQELSAGANVFGAIELTGSIVKTRDRYINAQLFKVRSNQLETIFSPSR